LSAQFYGSVVNHNVHLEQNATIDQIDPEDGSPYKKQYDPRKFLIEGEIGMIKRLDEVFSDLGSMGKSLVQ
jgi:fructose-bisphosphate aldolase class II